MIEPDWIAVDWGTSNLRVWAMSADGAMLAKRDSCEGMQGLAPADFEPVLLALINDWLPPAAITQVICCGMAGSRMGWVEAGYRPTPCMVNDLGVLAAAPTLDPRIRVHILAGIKQLAPADVMRGEETQIAGFIAQNSNFEGILCMPGTHSKWVQIKEGTVLGFTTYMTGELFYLLSEHSVLSGFLSTDGWDNAAFETAVEIAVESPAKVAAALFNLRAQSLIADLAPMAARARLSGLLIGLEIGATRELWQEQPIEILGNGSLSRLYKSALATRGARAVCHDIEALTLAGCAAGHRHLESMT